LTNHPTISYSRLKEQIEEEEEEEEEKENRKKKKTRQ
jgi:hypothetical protein